MDVLYVSQTIFYILASVVFLAIGIAAIVLTYVILKTLFLIKSMPEKVKKILEYYSFKIYEKITFADIFHIFRKQNRSKNKSET